MKPLLVIGIDSLDPGVLAKEGPDLPAFNRLRQSGLQMDMDSIFPVDSVPAWVTIFTGLNPAQHGIVYSFDIFESSLGDILRIDSSIFRGKTFWDYVSASGRKVCALFPMLAFPPWEVNGVMISRPIAERRVANAPEWVVEHETRAWPDTAMAAYGVPAYMKGVYGKHPGKANLGKWAQDARHALEEEVEIGLKVYRDVQPDLFFISLSWLDIIQHRVWRFFDHSDPTYPGRNGYGDIIREMYRLLDQTVGRFMEVNPGAATMVFSDHGHGVRPTRVVNMNKVLRQAGFLAARGGPQSYLLEACKNAVLGAATRLDLDYWLVRLSTSTKGLSSLSKGVYMSTANLDMSKTVAYLSSFAGVKSYSHGGIEIAKANLNGRDYEQVRDGVIREISGLRLPGSGEPLAEWVRRREELYAGDRVAGAFPDIVFQLGGGYGTGWGIRGPLFGRAYDHNLASGGHKKSAVLLFSNIDRQPARLKATLMDITPTILDLFQIPKGAQLRGESVFR